MTPSTFLHHNIPIVSLENESSNLVSIQLMFKVGSAHEPEHLWGITHLIEHMVFKGSEHYSAKEISYTIEACGADINAYTTKEYTVFYITGNSENLSVFLDVLLNICFHPIFPESEFEKEKDVIGSEIISVQDDPDELLYELAESSFFPEQSMGRSIAGSVDNVNMISLDDVKDYHQQYFGLSNCIVGIGGRFDIQLLTNKLDAYLSTMRSSDIVRCLDKLRFEQIQISKTYASEQFYLIRAYEACSCFDDFKYPLSAFNCMFASAMSSRLYQNLREEKGLCYSVDSDLTLYSNGGFIGLYVNSLAENASVICDVIDAEIAHFIKDGFLQKELDIAKNIMLFGLNSMFESVESRLLFEMKQILFYGSVLSKDRLVQKITQIGLDDVNDAIRFIFGKREAECKLFPLN